MKRDSHTFKKKLGSRLFICDPVCVQLLGHNVALIKYFRQYFADAYDTIYPVCCKFLPENVSKEYGFIPFFDFYYDKYVRITRREDLPPRPNKPVYIDELEAIATQDAEALIDEYHITRGDCIFYPSIDFYGVVGILNVLAKIAVEKSPRIFFRFIGVMENGTNAYPHPLEELLKRISTLLKKGYDIRVSAEAPRYADLIAVKIGQPVAVTPYPESGSLKPLPQEGEFVVFCPGSARLDKGFLQLFDIFSAVRRQDPDFNITFVAQTLPDHEAVHYQQYILRLYALPGVKLLEPSISETLMMDTYAKCSALLLPYDLNTYQYRSSAVVQEAVSLGRPVITITGTGFSSAVEYFGLGVVAADLLQLPAAIIELAKKNREEITRQAVQARHRFLSSVNPIYEEWMS